MNLQPTTNDKQQERKPSRGVFRYFLPAISYQLPATRGFTPTPILSLFCFFKKLFLQARLFGDNGIFNSRKKQSTTINLVSGFTLIETIVAIFILLTSVLAPMSIASKALSTARYAKEQVTAFYLAQEGIELVRNIRENTAMSGGSVWNEGPLGSSVSPETFCYAEGGCVIDAKNLAVSICSGGCSPLNIDSNGIYTYETTGSSPTSFTRAINIKKTSPTEISVSSTVSWVSSAVSGVKTFTITDNLLNWP